MSPVQPILLVLALVCFVLSAIGIPSRLNLTATGLAFWILSLLIPAFGTIHHL